MPPESIKKMKIELNYFDEVFCIKDADFSKVQPFSHADVVVNCDQPRSCIHGVLERKVESFLSETLAPFGIKAKWDKASEWHQLQQRECNEAPRISKLGMGMDFDL